jgi:hypothetical protein
MTAWHECWAVLSPPKKQKETTMAKDMKCPKCGAKHASAGCPKKGGKKY